MMMITIINKKLKKKDQDDNVRMKKRMCGDQSPERDWKEGGARRK